MKHVVWTLILSSVVACSSGADDGGDGDGGEGGSTSSTSSTTSSTDTGTNTSTSDLTEEQRLQIFCEKTMLPQCNAWFTSVDQCLQLMRQTASAVCEERWVKETDCLAETQAADWSCTGFGDPQIAGTRCRDEWGFGSFCRMVVTKAECYGAPCQYNADCPGSARCNEATAHCVEPTAECGALPCQYNSDCPDAFTCNDALEQCVVRD
ncbi:hypothetical protein [Chondromyces crocatus]|uniref:Uncharacterized protein n=1 Tax=Chondromyces crocatus TaxID=52 RepID=A0A0K1ELV1_CHOCO|nr:hypothetical protein [Chondromyces crocatus]AKT41806.1 uncharacterized protein CMC5_060170 [Chondromyces crocatus]